MQTHEPTDDDLSWHEVRVWIEIGCWAALVSIPLLIWINGPAVSTDQRVMRWCVVGVALAGSAARLFWPRHRT